MKNIFKKLFIPSGEKQTVVAYKSWIVRYYQWELNKEYSSLCHKVPQAEIFPSEEDANKFAYQLEAAFKFLKQKGSGTSVHVEENQNKLATITE